MRKLLVLLFVLISTAAMAQTTMVNFAWDKNADADMVTKYTLYEHVGAVYNKLNDVSTTACSATTCTYSLSGVVPGVHRYVVTATNSWTESGYSNEVATPGAVASPRNLVITITVTIP